MDEANTALYVDCRKGIFVLPDLVHESLASMTTRGWVYLREDDDVLTISATRIQDGYRRVLNGRFRAGMFRGATTLAIVSCADSLRVMAVS